MDNRWLFPLMLALASAVTACNVTALCDLPEETPSIAAGPGEGGNVLVVVLDDVGVDQLAKWDIGTIVAETPTIDCLCERGIRFTDAWASPLCSPARAGLLSGTYPHRFGINRFLHASRSEVELPVETQTIAELVKEAGYATGFAGKWHVSTFISPSGLDHPNVQGFDWFGGTISNIDHASTGERGLSYDKWEKVTNGEVELVRDYPTTVTVDDALELAETLPEPWLIVLSFHAPHVPVHRPPRKLLKGDRPGKKEGEDVQYRSMIQAIDIELNRFFTQLDPQRLADTTVFLFGDNGTPKHGIMPPFSKTRSKGSMYEGGARVPMVITGPHVAEWDVSSDALVALVDILPTLGEIAGVTPQDEIDGLSMMGVMADPEAEVHEFLFTHNEGASGGIGYAARDRGHKLVRWEGGVEKLFDMEGVTLDEGMAIPEEEWGPEAQQAYGRLVEILDTEKVVIDGFRD